MDNITVGGVTLHSPLLNAAGTMGSAPPMRTISTCTVWAGW